MTPPPGDQAILCRQGMPGNAGHPTLVFVRCGPMVTLRKTGTMAYIDKTPAVHLHVGESEAMGPADRTTGIRYELRFRSLFREGRGWAFPCDAAGRVDMDSMSERARNNYMFARAVIGIEV